VLWFLREIGEVPAAGSVAGAAPAEALLAEFGDWLAGERGLSAATVRCYAKQARKFLAQLPEPLDAALLGYLEQAGPAVADLAGLLAGRLGEGLQWDRVRTARCYWKLTGDTDRVLPELLALADTNPAGTAAIEALGWLGPAARAVRPQLEDWLARDARLGGSGAINDAVERDETFRATARATLAAVTGTAKSP
jgi:hypothetical protein